MSIKINQTHSKLIVILIVLFGIYCCNHQKEKFPKDVMVFSYKLLDKTMYSFDQENITTPAYKGVVVMNVSDTIIPYLGIAEAIIQICKHEDLILAKFYLDESCWLMDKGELYKEEDLYKKCYLGSLIATEEGIDWKNNLTVENINFYNVKGPLKIRIRK